MKTIFIIDGTSSIWKSDLINYVSSSNVRSAIFMKSSTRHKRPEETRTDLKFVSEKAFESSNFDLQYTYDGKKYGFHKKDIDFMLSKVDNIFIVIRNLEIIQEFSKMFSQYNIVTAFIYTDFHIVSKRIPQANSIVQKKSIANAFQDYLRHPNVYDEIIINGGTVNDFNRLIDLLINKFTNPKFGPRILVKPKGNHFIIDLSKTVVARVFLPIIISTFSTILFYQFLLNNLATSNPILLQIVLISISLAIYFVPQLLFIGIIKSKEKYEKNKTWFEYIHLVIAIIVYIVMLYTYIFEKH